MKTMKPAHVLFINGMITYRDRIRAYMEAYPRSSASSAKANASRLMKNPLIKAYIDHYYEMEAAQKDREHIESIKKRFTDFMDRQDVLWDIANGEPLQKKTAEGIITMRYPAVGERLSAMFTALGNEKRFLSQYPEYASWLEDEENELDVLPSDLPVVDGNVKNEVRNLLMPRQQRLSIYLRDVSRQSLYSKGS